MFGSQIEPPWQPRPPAQRFASLRAALVLPVAFQRRTVVPTAGGIGHPMAFAGLWDGRRRSDGAVARREDGLRSRDRPLATDRDANALGGPDDPPCGWLRRKVDRGRESSQRRMVHYRWVPAGMEFISARAWRVLADRRAARNAGRRRIAHPRIQARAETAQAG